jgi:hypothetical protein
MQLSSMSKKRAYANSLNSTRKSRPGNSTVLAFVVYYTIALLAIIVALRAGMEHQHCTLCRLGYTDTDLITNKTSR